MTRRVRSSCLALALAAFCGATLAQAAPTVRATAPRVVTPEVKALDQVQLFHLPALDTDLLRFEDELASEQLGAPLRFAVPHPVALTPHTAGDWSVLADGRQVWRLRVEAEDTHSLNFGFTRYRMPVGGRLVISSADRERWVGPFGARDNQSHGELWTPILPGGDAVLEVVLPAGQRDALELELGAINQGYRDVLGGGTADGFDKSGSCNVDVACSQGDAWREQIRSVVAYSRSGFAICSGAMVNNTAQDLKPLLLTAEHCGITAANDQTVVLYWKYQNSTCRAPGSASSGGPGDGPLTFAQTGGGVLRASNPNNENTGLGSDFALLEMSSAPQDSFDPFWAGWDRRDRSFSSAVGIHHPQVEEKRISFENDPLELIRFGGSVDTHLVVLDWDTGTTEGGSSGSPLFNANGLVIGQLHGGFAACGNDDEDYYGRLAASWTGAGTESTRLRDWLDPLDTGATTLAGTDEVVIDPPPPPDDEPPVGPSLLTATLMPGGIAHLEWSDNSDDEDGFEIHGRTGNGSFQSLGTVPPNVVAADVTGLGVGTHTFKVRAFNEHGSSAFSNQAAVTITGGGGPTTCVETDTTLCLNGGRFQVEIDFRSNDASGQARGERLTDDTAWFYFFNEDNVELVVKALDACNVPGFDHYWVFAAGLTNVEVELKVTDTANGQVRLYENKLGTPFQPIQDTGAFATCP